MTLIDRFHFRRTYRKLRRDSDIENAYTVIRFVIAWEGYTWQGR